MEIFDEDCWVDVYSSLAATYGEEETNEIIDTVKSCSNRIDFYLDPVIIMDLEEDRILDE